MTPHIDWSVPIWSIVLLVVSLISGYVALSGRIKVIETRMDTIWEWWKNNVVNKQQSSTNSLEETPSGPMRREADRMFKEIIKRDRQLGGYRES